MMADFEQVLMEDMQDMSPVDDVLIVDAESRTVLVPGSELIMGVEEDERGERKLFRIPKVVGNGIDVTACTLHINYRNANGDTDYTPIDRVNDEGDYLTFVWELPRKFTKYKGNVQFIVCVCKSVGGVIQNEWHTTLATGRVLEGLQALDHGDEEPTLDIIARLEGIAKGVAASAASSAASSLAAANERSKAESSASSAAASAASAAANANAASASAEAAEELLGAIDDPDAIRYGAYATHTQSGNFAVYTDVGADDIPLKKILVSRTNSAAPAVSTVKIRQLGKNLFSSAESAFVVGSVIKDDGSIESNSNYAYSKVYTPVLPNTDYVFSGRVVGTKTANTVAFYDANGVFLSRFTPKKADGTTTAFNTPAQFKTPWNCHFIRYNTSYNVFECDDVQLEVGKIATSFEEYDPTDYTINLKNVSGGSLNAKYRSLELLKGTGITFSGTAIRFTPPLVKTRLGTNYFYVVTGTEGAEQIRYAAKTSATLRLDPTLVYEKLNAAIIAAGSV